jgi:hypothetical protein
MGMELGLSCLREERRLGVFEDRVLMRVFGPQTEGVMGGLRKLYIVQHRGF